MLVWEINSMQEYPYKKKLYCIIANNIMNYIGINETFIKRCFFKMNLTGNGESHYTAETIKIPIDVMFKNVDGKGLEEFNKNTLQGCLDTCLAMVEKIKRDNLKGEYSNKYYISFVIDIYHAINNNVPIEIKVGKYAVVDDIICR